jgi:hypothetical protein
VRLTTKSWNLLTHRIDPDVDDTRDYLVQRAPGYTIGYLEQEPVLDDTKTVRAIVEEGVQEVVDALRQFDDINAQFATDLAEDAMEALIARQASVQDQLDMRHAWDSTVAWNWRWTLCAVCRVICRCACSPVASAVAWRCAVCCSEPRIERAAGGLPGGLAGARKRIAELQTKYRLVPASEPVFYACDGDPRNEVIATFFQTDPPTLIAERGDRVSLM